MERYQPNRNKALLPALLSLTLLGSCGNQEGAQTSSNAGAPSRGMDTNQIEEVYIGVADARDAFVACLIENSAEFRAYREAFRTEPPLEEFFGVPECQEEGMQLEKYDAFLP